MSKTAKSISYLKGIGAFFKVGTWSEATARVLDHAFDNPQILEEQSTMLLAGGIMQYGYQCGILWGAALGAGARAFQLYGSGPKGESGAILASQKIMESFVNKYKEFNCLELTETDWKNKSQMIKYMLKGGTIRCFNMVGKFIPIAYRDINSTLSDIEIESPSPPVSCAAMTAKKMGASDKQATLVAGYAGGIGLSGGACGALGVATWLLDMERCKEGSRKFEFENPKVTEAIERFLESSDYKFECAEIVGRKFESVADHADFLRGGGCAKIIEVLGAIKS